MKISNKIFPLLLLSFVLTGLVLSLFVGILSWGESTVLAADNLIINSSLELSAGADPANWHRGGWGTNTAIFTYPTAGETGNGASIQITSYTDGDAKWYFDDVAVTPGQQYIFSDSYKSNTDSNITVRFLLTSGAYSYVGLDNLSAAPTWQSYSKTFTAPANAISFTAFHLLNKVGVLSIDNASLTSGITPTPTPTPNVTPTPSSTTTPTPSSTPMPTGTPIPTDNLIINPSLEVSSNGITPGNWHFNNWGTNNAQPVYPAAGSENVQGIGFDLSRGAEVVVSSYNSGDAKWYFDDVAVTPGQQYQFSDYYKSTVQSLVVARYTSNTGAVTYTQIGTLEPNSNWQKVSTTIIPPAGVISA